MISNSLDVATKIINTAQIKANTAAQQIAQLPVQDQEVAGSEPMKSSNLFNSVLSLKESELQTAAGAKVVEAEKKMLGAIIDVRA